MFYYCFFFHLNNNFRFIMRTSVLYILAILKTIYLTKVFSHWDSRKSVVRWRYSQGQVHNTRVYYNIGKTDVLTPDIMSLLILFKNLKSKCIIICYFLIIFLKLADIIYQYFFIFLEMNRHDSSRYILAWVPAVSTSGLLFQMLKSTNSL